MPSFGDKLRKERESRGTRIDEIADRTKIRAEFLTALEANDFDRLPGGAFGKFYIRAYAEVVGFDPAPFIVEYDRERQRLAEPAEERPADTPVKRRRRTTWRERPSAPETEAPATRRPTRDPQIAGFKTRLREAAKARRRPSAEPVVDPIPAVAAPPPVDPEPAPPARVVVADRRPAGGPPWRALGLAAGVVGVLFVIIRIVLPLGGEEVPPPTPLPARPAARAEAPPPARVEARPAARDATRPEPVTAAAVEPAAVEPAAADPEPRPAEPEAAPPSPAAPSGSLSVTEHGVGLRVVNHRLDGRGGSFEEGNVVVFWTRVMGGVPGDVVRHVWLRDGGWVQTTELELGGSHWRTHSRKTLWGVGDWAVEARDTDGRVLARAEFRCVPRGR